MIGTWAKDQVKRSEFVVSLEAHGVSYSKVTPDQRRLRVTLRPTWSKVEPQAAPRTLTSDPMAWRRPHYTVSARSYESLQIVKAHISFDSQIASHNIHVGGLPVSGQPQAVGFGLREPGILHEAYKAPLRFTRPLKSWSVLSAIFR
jgi:hypothetical protein